MNSSLNWELMAFIPGSVLTLRVAVVLIALLFVGAPMDVGADRFGGIGL